MSNHTDGVLLRGLDGANPLAFLAALGTLRTLTLALSDETVRMSWEQSDGAWRPRVFCSLDGDADAVVTALDGELRKGSERTAFKIGDNLNLSAEEFHSHLRDATNSPEFLTTLGARIDADFLAAFGSEAITDDDGAMTDTALRTMSGAGHQHFLKVVRELIAKTDAEHLRRSLLLHWDYADEGRGLNLRWDPLDDRRYALRWWNPSSDPVKTMRGANRLAIEALPLLPTIPVDGRLATTAFVGKGARDTFFKWPIWNVLLALPVVASLLSHAANFSEHHEIREARGVCALYKSARITTGKFRNFTPGTPL